MTDLFDKAMDEYGLKEVLGFPDNPRIIQFFDDLGFNGKQLKDETAWCSAFVNWCAKECGYEYTKSLAARSWLKIGKATKTPKRGDVVVFWRESRQSWKGHVGLFVKERDGMIYVLGGNQGNQVNIKAYPASRLLEYRTLKKVKK